jgi:general secretion pathway protein D
LRRESLHRASLHRESLRRESQDVPMASLGIAAPEPSAAAGSGSRFWGGLEQFPAKWGPPRISISMFRGIAIAAKLRQDKTLEPVLGRLDPDARARSVRGRPLVPGLWTLGLALVLGAALSGCTLTAVGDAGTGSPDAIDRIRELDLSPRQVAGGAASEPSGGVRARVYYGADGYGGDTGAAAGPGTAPAAGLAEDGADVSADGIVLDFENTPVASVAKVILGDFLHVGYVIDPRVQGTISLSSSGRVAKADLVLVLENALRSANAVMVRDRTGYRIVPSEEAIGIGPTEVRGRAAEPGYGVTVIPLRHVAVPAMLKLVDGFAAKAGSIRGEPSANLVMVTGTSAERQSVLDTVRSFDADWMRGQSVGIFPVNNSTPDPLVAELEKILDSGESGLGHGLVKVLAVGRLNAILVVARKPELLRRAGTWIARLDASAVAATGVKVYKVRYGEARQIARLLSDMFIGAGRAGTQEDTGIAPGAGTTSASAFDRVGGGAATQASTQQGQGGFGQGAGQQGGLGQGGLGQGGFGTPQGGDFGEDQQPYGALRPATAQEGAATGAGAAGGTGQALLPGVRIVPDVVNNAILIYASPANYKIIERTLTQLDRPQLQVAIEATFAEVTLNDTLQYGVQFFLGSSNLGLGTDNGSALNTASFSTTQPPSSVQPQLPGSTPGFNLVFGNALTPRAVISALHRFTDVKILSNPSLVVVNNQAATLRVGDQVSITTGQVSPVTGGTTNVVNTFEYRDTGVILNVRPRINFNGNVFLQIEQEISNQATFPVVGNPTFSQRRVRSSVVVASGQTVLLAGLIAHTQNRERDGIPILDQLPLFGDAFSTSNTKNLKPRTELIVFIRPQVIRDGVDAAFVAEELRAKIRGDKIGSLRPLGAIQPDPPPAAAR